MKSSDIVVYHNALNKVPFSQLNEIERNLVMILLCQVKEKGGEVISFPIDVIKKHLIANYTNDLLKQILVGLKEHFFNLKFEVMRELNDKYQAIDTHHLFNRFTLITNKDKSGEIERIELQVNPPFLFIVNNLVNNFTSFEIQEFCSIRGKYAKDLYRLLKQYRTSGIAIFKWSDFKEQMGFSEKASVRDIDKIIDKSIKELSRELDLIDKASKRQAFTNLTATKNYDLNRRGRPITTITFTFKKEIPTKQGYKEVKKAIAAKNK